jgi:TatD DNase family protein
VNYLDAHNHLHDARFAAHHTEMLRELSRIGVAAAVVNGTREDDWCAVKTLAAKRPFVIPSYGLHPWYVQIRSPEWLNALREYVTKSPRAAVGEVGLDRWIEGYDLDEQKAVFAAQIEVAVECNRPLTIHCIRAWGVLMEILSETKLPTRGFLLHAYGGPAEMIAGFAQRGAYFSFSPYFLNERKRRQRDVFREIPADRLLVETDAPDLRPPDERNPRPLHNPDGEPINHPANIDVAYAGLAETRDVSVDELANTVTANFERLFGPIPS